ncbi:MAG: hypothetical protein IPK68_14595 [Bdellovibrionales bacterium]|nr:hypothetical protein [Bdellovibrionales bacterium]
MRSYRINTFQDCESIFMKAVCGKTARTVCAADGGQRRKARLLRLDKRYGKMMKNLAK